MNQQHLVGALLVACLTNPVPAQTVKKLIASGGAAHDQSGSAIAISGLTAVVGIPGKDDVGIDAGAAFVFVRNTGGLGNWGEMKRLTASDARPGDAFGAQVSVSGETIVIGAPRKSGVGADAGAAYIFVRSHGGKNTWGQTHKLTPSDAAAGDRFGSAVSISADTVIIGATHKTNGAAYVFARHQGGFHNWGQVKKLTASSLGAPRRFGVSLAIAGNTAVVGAVDTSVSGSAGAAFVFERDQGGSSNWGQTRILPGANGVHFGRSVSLSRDTIAVGAHLDDGAGTDAGAAFVFVRDLGGTGKWGQAKKLTAGDAAGLDHFGYSVAISEDRLVVGAPNAKRGISAGASYLFARHQAGSDAWGQVSKLIPGDGARGDRFGSSSAFRDGVIAMGAPDAAVGSNSNQGAGYLFDLGFGTWSVLGHALAGSHGKPGLVGSGRLSEGSLLTLVLSNARAQTTSFLAVGVSSINLPFMGGTLVPEPLLVQALSTGGVTGTPTTLTSRITVPTVVPRGIPLYFQHWILDPSGPYGLAASNAVRGTTLRSLFRKMSNWFDATLLAAGTPATSLRIYTTQNFANKTFVRNPNCWAAGIDLTGLSPWNQSGANRRAGTLVSPRHVVFARHYALSTAAGRNEIVFVTSQNVTVTRKVIGVSYPAADIGVGLLDADVPVSIKFYKVLKNNWNFYLGSTDRLPMLHLDQEEKALVRDMATLNRGSTYCYHNAPINSRRRQFSETLIGGDSGNPAFVVVDGEAILVLTHHYATGGPFYTTHIGAINASMKSLGGGYQLTELDLSVGER